jgi:uncharacterized membrane protein YfcA
MDPKLSIAGLLVGVLVGMTGMGGGSLLTPMLVLLFGFKPTIAVGTDVLHGAIFKSFGAWSCRRLDTIHVMLGVWMFAASAPASLLGVLASHHVGESAETTQKFILGVALVVCGLGYLAKVIARGKINGDTLTHLSRRDKAIALALGAAGGFVVGLTSVGSGTFFGLVLMLAFPLSAARLVGTDIFHAAALLWVAGIAHLASGNVDLAAMGSLLVGSIPGVLVGSRMTVKVPDRPLRIAFACVLFLSGLKLMDVPGSDYLVVAVLVGGGVTLLIHGLLALRGRLAPATEQ